MSKLGYTFYPKDWASSESVFELKLHERGLYRELMDLAYLNDNKTEIKRDTWTRKFACTLDELNQILERLFTLKLIEYKDNLIFIPSCENRLNLSRGGKNSKPTETTKNNLKNLVNSNLNKPTSEPISEPISEPTSEQIEKKENIKEKNTTYSESENAGEDIGINKHQEFETECLQSQEWMDNISMKNKIPPDKIKFAIKEFNQHLITIGEDKKLLKDYKYHFASWSRKVKENTS